MTRGTRTILSFATAAAAAITTGAPGGGLERFWQPLDLFSGDFNDPAQWLDGFTLGVPGASDTAIFDVNSFYTVSFPIAEATDRVIVRSGTVNFDLLNAYSLLNPLPTTPGIVVGEGNTDSARLGLSGGSLSGSFTRLGLGEGSFGWLVVSGAEAALLNSSTLSAGEQGAGILDILLGAGVENGPASIGAGAGAFGDVTVAGTGSSWLIDGLLAVGKFGAGGLTIEDGAAVSSAGAIIAQNDSSFGDVLVRGAGSSWSIDGSLDVGMLSLGTLTIEDGASVNVSGFVTAGTFPTFPPYGEIGGVGEIRVSGPGSVLSVGADCDVGYLSAGRWTLSSGGRVVVGDFLATGDWLDGDPLPQTLIELSSAGDYATLPVFEVGVSTDGSIPISVELVGGFVPETGDAFEILSVGAGPLVVPAFTLPSLPPPRSWLVQSDSDSVRLLVGPEPDIDGNGVVGINDLLTLLADWGPCAGCPADLDGDGEVAIPDLLLLLAAWD